MAKGQSRRNREVRKPKADKPKPAISAADASMAMLAAINAPKKKK